MKYVFNVRYDCLSAFVICRVFKCRLSRIQLFSNRCVFDLIFLIMASCRVIRFIEFLGDDRDTKGQKGCKQTQTI